MSLALRVSSDATQCGVDCSAISLLIGKSTILTFVAFLTSGITVITVITLKLPFKI